VKRRWLWLVAVGLLAILAVATLWVMEWRQRASTASVEQSVAHHMNAASARCANHSSNGSTWTCKVGPEPDPECKVIHVSPFGSVSIVERPNVCRYP
jgi:hypothetical protein